MACARAYRKSMQNKDSECSHLIKNYEDKTDKCELCGMTVDEIGWARRFYADFDTVDPTI